MFPTNTQIPNTFTTACGGTIHVNDDTRAHLAAHPESAGFLAEAIRKITLPTGEAFLVSVDMGRIVGVNACITAPEMMTDDCMWFAFRKGSIIPTRVSENTPEQTNLFSVIAKKQPDGTWLLATAYPGSIAPREPHDPKWPAYSLPEEFFKALAFWCTHALLYDRQTMGPMFEATWDDVMAYARVATAHAEAEVAQAKAAKRSNCTTCRGRGVIGTLAIGGGPVEECPDCSV